ncbi:MAG: GPW/gp25 family protein [Pseudomonadota bacterium]|uniref:GPW/gp25 family protein n=1 Tax=Sphingomonas sp. ERG5 TaxID=1381597 RepID=UPI00054BDA1D|nr:GPW/gp25 family protein [Sphingomonas sp. ERG5]
MSQSSIAAVRGPAYPFAIDPETGGVAWSNGKRKLADNVRLILTTRTGERPMARDFGTPIHSLVHEPNEGGLARLIARHVREGLMQLEPRIIVSDITFHQDNGELTLELTYQLADDARTEIMLVQLG